MTLCVQHFLSVHLVAGAVEVEFGGIAGASGRVTVKESDEGSFTEGIKHSVIISISRK